AGGSPQRVTSVTPPGQVSPPPVPKRGPCRAHVPALVERGRTARYTEIYSVVPAGLTSRPSLSGDPQLRRLRCHWGAVPAGLTSRPSLSGNQQVRRLRCHW